MKTFKSISDNKKQNMRNFILLYIGQVISQLGSGVTSFAVIIWAYSESGKVMASSLLAICSTVPYLIVSLLGGAVADNVNKKKIMLICDTVAAAGSLVILLCFLGNSLSLWILCIINVISGFMNAFQAPASQVAVSLLIDKEDYARVGGVQSIIGSVVGILTPVLAAGLLGIGGLGLIIIVDLSTFLFAFLMLLFFVKIPDIVSNESRTSLPELWYSMKEGIGFIKKEHGIRLLLVMYSVLNFMGAISFDSMYSPLLLARTGNNEMVVGIVSAFMAAGIMMASIFLMVSKTPEKKLPIMYVGSFMCLAGIMLFGMGRNIYWWCAVVFIGCFGAPIYQTYQTVILREKVSIDMHGRIFGVQGMITQMLTPIGYLVGALLADYVFEPFMQGGRANKVLSLIVGSGNGAGIGLIFVIAGALGIVILAILRRSSKIKELDEQY